MADRSIAFEAERARLAAVAARILGSSAEADDVVQEAWLRLSRTEGVDDLPAWLTTVTTRLCLDQLRKRQTRVRAEGATPIDPGNRSSATDAWADPESDALLAERVGEAMQVVLDTLAPAERAAFVLHDVFGYPFEEISAALGRSGTAVRQLASRARRKMQGRPEPDSERTARAESRRVVDAFLAAAHGGELDMLMSLIAPDAVMSTDPVGRQMGADPDYVGAEAVAARFNGSKGALAVTIDGERGAAWIMAKQVKVAFVFQVHGGQVREIELIGDPEVLATMDVERVRPPPRGRGQIVRGGS